MPTNSVEQKLGPNAQAALQELRERLVELLAGRPFTAVLFGSRARGDFDTYSDLDVSIIVGGLDRPLKRLIIDLVIDIETKYETYISPLVMSSEEFDALRRRERRIALDIEREGISF